MAPKGLLVQALVSPLRVTLDASEALDQAMAQRAQRHPACPLLQALPGAGPVVASRLLVAFGEQRARYPAAAARQQEAGIAPVTERRGKKAWVHWRLQGPKCRRHSCVAWAAASIRPAFWAQVSDQQQRAQGKTPPAAVRALALPWSRILERCWQEHTPYDESTSLQALSRRGSSLLHHLAKEA
jgi:Transposase IS116/IS110/IS902 family